MQVHLTRLRHSVRAVVLDEEQRILLCRFDIADKDLVVWATPGGGLEVGESPLDALRRELDEEVGLHVDEEPAHVWHQVVTGPDYAPGYDGIINDYFLVRTRSFRPRGSFSEEQLTAEGITGFRWWTTDDLQTHRGPALFGPRALPRLLHELLDDGVPPSPHSLGL